MGWSTATRVVDVSDVRFRVRTISAGVWITVAALVPIAFYVLQTLDEPNRALIAGLMGLALIGGAAVAMLPHERIVRSRWCEHFFLGWSALDLMLIGALAAADGGAKSPLALIFFVPIVFGALSYPLSSVVILSLLDVGIYEFVGLTVGNPDYAHLGMVSGVLALTAGMCIWQARNHDSQRDELARVSRSDPLTGCLNRRGLEERMEAGLADALRHGRCFGLVVLDLDDFKQVNDTHGHAAGDELLAWTVSELESVLRPLDAVGRLGGDEFAILLPGCGPGATADLAKRARAVLASRIEACTGRATFPLDGMQTDALLSHADSELYAAKAGVRSRPAPAGRDLAWAATLAASVDIRMAMPHDHSGAVAVLAAGAAERLGWAGADLARLRIAAMLHDVGKIAVPEGILRKPTALTGCEYEQLKPHSVAGAELVARIEGLADIVPWIRHSHEHFDGSGYPDGLAGEEIPLAARILLVADAFDAMTSDRPYREAMRTDEALAELASGAGGQFDPSCVDALDAYVHDTIGALEPAA